MVHVVEDVHWADRATLDLLAFLATNFIDERVLLLLTYRNDAVDETRRSAPGWPSWAGSRRCGSGCPASTGPTPPRWRPSWRGAPDAGAAGGDLERSAGNPLFVEQLVLAGDGPGPLPATLHELLRGRVERLPRRRAGCCGRPR